MENFDRAVTDPRLKRLELEQWIQANPDPRKKFADDFIVVHDSGCSGIIGIFVYHQKAWRIADDAVASLLPRPEVSYGIDEGSLLHPYPRPFSNGFRCCLDATDSL